VAAEVVVSLQDELRGELKDPLGPIFSETEALLAEAGEPLVAVGDMVTYHLLEAGRVPDAALIDEKTKRSQVAEDVRRAITGFDREVAVENPAATLTTALLDALRAGVADDATTLLDVDGEEDLATLPAVLLAPPGASVVYGQPDEGMVLVTVEEATTDRVRDLLARMEGDTERLWSLLDVTP
jgi:uncharacterized protein (UPF0218 family)